MGGFYMRTVKKEDGSRVVEVFKLINVTGPFEPWNMESITEVQDYVIGSILIGEIEKLEGIAYEG